MVRGDILVFQPGGSMGFQLLTITFVQRVTINITVIVFDGVALPI